MATIKIKQDDQWVSLPMIGVQQFPDAPSDGKQYGRKDGAWAVIEAGGTQYLDLSMFSSESGTLSEEDYQKVVKAYEDGVISGYSDGGYISISIMYTGSGYFILSDSIAPDMSLTSMYISVVVDGKIYIKKTNIISLKNNGSGTKALTDNGQYAEFAKPTKVESGGSGTVTKQIKPNTFYKFGSCSKLTITFAAEESGIENEYKFEFVSGTTPTTLSLPDSIKWKDGKEPTMEASKTYQVSIVNNLAVYAAF